MIQQVEIYGSPQLVGASTLIGRQMTCRSGEPFVRLWWLGGVISGVRALWRRHVTVWRHRGPFDDIWGPLMTSGVLCCYHGTLMAALEALSVAVANGAFVPWHPPQSQSTGTNIYFGLTPKVKAGPMDPLGPQFEVDSLSDFRASRDGSGPSGQIRAPQDKPGPSRTNQGPAERIRASLGQPEPRGANQGPAGRVRAPGRIGSRGMSQGPAEKINELGQIRTLRDEPEHH